MFSVLDIKNNKFELSWFIVSALVRVEKCRNKVNLYDYLPLISQKKYINCSFVSPELKPVKKPASS